MGDSCQAVKKKFPYYPFLGERGAAQPRDPYRYLALAMVAQAIAEAREGSKSARAWLAEEAPAWLDLCGVDYDPGRWAAWICAGLPRR